MKRAAHVGAWLVAASGCTGARSQAPTTADAGAPHALSILSLNPYPSGFLVEGMAALVLDTWIVLDRLEWRLRYNRRGDELFVQVLALAPRATLSPWVLVANLHGGHKVAHFEQAVALRRALARTAREASHTGRFGGVVLAGDFNAMLYRPSRGEGEVSTVPWEVSADGEFDVRTQEARATLEEELWALNEDPSYKPWARIADPVEARARIADAVSELRRFLDEVSDAGERIGSPLLEEALDRGAGRAACAPDPRVAGACELPRRIDLLFADPSIRVENAYIAYRDNDSVSLSGPSDHPAIYARLLLPR